MIKVKKCSDDFLALRPERSLNSLDAATLSKSTIEETKTDPSVNEAGANFLLLERKESENATEASFSSMFDHLEKACTLKCNDYLLEC